MNPQPGIKDRIRLLERLKAEAEMEMRRKLDEGRPCKRQKHAAEGGPLDFVPVDRFRYSVVEDLEAGAAGFIITCNFRKEKSATREALQLLRRYLPARLFPEPVHGNPEDGTRQQRPQQQQGPWQQEQQPLSGEAAGADAGMAAGGEAASGGPGSAKNAAEDVGGAGAKVAAAGAAAAGADEEDGDDSSSSTDDEEAGGPGGHELAAAGQGGPGGDAGGNGPGQPSTLALAKVACRGVVLMRLSASAAAEVDTVEVVAAMLRDLESGTLQPPKHCQRIIPLDATCALTAAGLRRAVAQAAAAHRRRRQPSVAAADAAADAAVQAPFTYAVVYRSRQVEGGGSESTTPGTAATPTATATATAAAATSGAAGGPAPPGAGAEGVSCGGGGKDADEALLSDRGRIISLVAGGMAAAFGESAKVELKKPQVAMLVETVPVAGRHFVGLALLGQQLFHAKGKIITKPLIKNAPSA